ncbi:cytochrome P450 [Aspergillus alliaceus]|uniref:Cytochrome P450 n=1 Tax=Petromyces alliaceus TaxID=209559 RepID=A0A5N7CH99_PETAA|nr:cytochrome P450 [Aspergillus alliaceus]
MVICAIAIVIFALTFLRVLSNYARLRTVPGPLFTGLCDWWRIYIRSRGNYGYILDGLHKEYGKVVRLGPYSISVSDPTVILPVHKAQPGERSIFENNASIVFAKEPSIDGARFAPTGSRLTSEAVGRMHLESAMRYEGIVDELARRLIAHLRRYPFVHLTVVLEFFAADFVHHLNPEEWATQHMPSTEAAGSSWHNHLGRWLRLPMIEYALLQSSTAKLKRSRGISLARKVVQGGMTDTPYHALYDHPARSNLSLVKTSLKADGTLKNITMAFVSTFFFLLEHRDVMTRLRREIVTAQDKGLLSDPPRWRELGRLRYLDAVFKESMRQLYGLAYDHETVAPAEGAIVAGCYIPPGTTIELHPEVARRDPGIYGDDAHHYRPVRWLNADPQQRRLMGQNLLSLSTVNSCPMARVAWLELKKVIVLILIDFNFQLVSPREELALDSGFGQDVPPLMVYCTPRLD